MDRFSFPVQMCGKRWVFLGLSIILFSGLCALPMVWAQSNNPSQDELRKLFLQSREQMHRRMDQQTPTATPEPQATRRPASQATPAPRATPQSDPRVRPTPQARPTATPRAERRVRATPTPRAARTPRDRRAPIVVAKDGVEDELDEEPTPTPERRRWSLFGRRDSGPQYRYLSDSVRRQIDAPSIRRNRWRFIVVHNSASRNGNARIFDNYHRRVRKMRNGMAYHFVIGNGSASGDGAIEVGERWARQLNGGHLASDNLNNIAIGICLVGDFDRHRPTQAQLESLEELITYLRGRAGNVRRKRPEVKGHREINPRPTSCPGRNLPVRWLNRQFN
ncbi:MAG: N-acetylmuramoyl-L-alanine amidase [Verrucomicrobiales bacterium]